MIEHSFDIASLREGYRQKRFTPVEVVRESLRRIGGYSDPAVWIARAPEEEVISRAAALTAQGLSESMPLWGIPFAVKDNIDAASLPTTAACPAFAYTPERNAFVVDRLIAAGAILMGKTNLDQFATGLVGTRSPYGAPRCVFNERYVSGGSSSGSAVAVAAELVSFALGTDTAGSGRVPAAYNNIVGLKPTRGLVSASGVVPACRSLDCVSIFAGTVGDADEVLRAVKGFDSADIYSRSETPRPLSRRGFRFGYLARPDREFFGNAECENLYTDAIRRAESIGGLGVEIDYAPFRAAAELLYGGAWAAERLAAIKDFIAEHEMEMDPSVRTIIAGARPLTAVQAFDGQYCLAAARRAAESEWAKADVLLLPTVPAHHTVEEVAADPIAVNARLGRYTNFVNLLDCCAIAVPAGFRSNGLPFGVTLIAPAFSDAGLARLADGLHRAGKFGMGRAVERELPAASRLTPHDAEDKIALLVVGAHLSGMALNHELKRMGAVFAGAVRTAPKYRLYVLPNTQPEKPGLVHRPSTPPGPGVSGELWTMSPEDFGRFVAYVPAPLGIGKVMLDDGRCVSGFLCEAYAVENAADITNLGGWRRYIESRS